ncbi:hypothetical protein [Hymenobacter arizonensis]|uniref:Uncharacterized protein n=1 Tax=Hymenobacter arizonensis TaxID=1227077 RepID=A0A1I5ZNL2_HYMAR|nr:hypothetical protein [Hymenobacter arizonensis]SFQ58066.1 hypothetical protein SAMN04515668_3070 [Hymenobacter arizonensis]
MRLPPLSAGQTTDLALLRAQAFIARGAWPALLALAAWARQRSPQGRCRSTTFAVLLLASQFFATAAQACPVCRPKVEAGIYGADYAPHLLLVLLPVAVLLGLGLGLFYWDKLTTRSARPYATPLP